MCLAHIDSPEKCFCYFNYQCVTLVAISENFKFSMHAIHFSVSLEPAFLIGKTSTHMSM